MKINNSRDQDYLKTLTVLYVEDDADTRNQFCEFLRRSVGTLIAAENGVAGLETFKKHTPDIVITDILMPQMDGLTMAREILEMIPTVPIIVLTAFEQTDYLMRAINMGIEKYVTKPVNSYLLFENLLECAHRLRAEELIKPAKDAAEAANQAKSSFLANMSHEIRTPLNSLIGLTEVLLRTELNRHQKDTLTIVHSSGSALLHLLSGVLDFSKIETGHITIAQLPFNIETVLREVHDLHCIHAEAKGFTLRTEFAPDVPVKLIGDAQRLLQVLGNLVDNAIKFTVQGEVILNVSIDTDAAQVENSVTLRVAVRDSGIGIATEQQENIFHPFVQADNALTRRYGGTGLGLAICENLVRLMGGKLEVESTLGQGACFSFSLPLSVPQYSLIGSGSASTAPVAALPMTPPGRTEPIFDTHVTATTEQTPALFDEHDLRKELSVALNCLKPILSGCDLVPRDLLQTLQRLEETGNPVSRMIAYINNFEHEQALRTLMEIEKSLSDSVKNSA